ncbi:Crp/Fnr family transcriptional regulator [Sulfitobacter aestuariivivens]|uniref:Crp/Fnr family transcriptional regulator n=1 Tax=Sulfitobacter aestuariivivens TaxID=2766981 RepID=UPI003607BBAB
MITRGPRARQTPDVSPLYRLAQKDRDWLLSQQHVRRILIDGENLNTIQNASGMVYLIETGWLAECEFLRNGRRQILDFYLPGDLIVSSDKFSDLRGRCIESIGPASVLVFDVSAAQPDPRLENIEKQVLTLRAEAFGNLLVNVGRRSAMSRLAHFLLRTDAKLRVRPDGDESITVPSFVTQSDIADHLGISTVHTNKTLAKLRQAGFVSQPGQAIALLSRERLEQLRE